MKRILKRIAFLVIIAVIALVAWHFFAGRKSSEAGALISEKVTQMTIATTISATGTVNPADSVEVGTQVSGEISKIFVDYNDKVKMGQVIAELDKSKLQATLYQAQVAYESAKTDYQYKKSVYGRTKKLSETNSASTADLESDEYAMNSAKWAVDKSKSEVDQAKINLGYAVIRSPINGVVLVRSVDVGQTVAASMSTPTLFVLAKDLSKMKVLADVDEADIGAVKKGQRVEFTVDAYPDDEFKGSVLEVRLNPKTTSNVVTYTVVIEADNSGLKLLPGMTATCTIVTQEVENALCVPAKALKFTPADGTPMVDMRDMPRRSKHKDSTSKDRDDMGPPDMGGSGFGGGPGGSKKKSSSSSPRISGNLVWMDLNGKAAPHPVKIGISDGVNVQILKGLSLGDSVVVSQEDLTSAVTATSEATSPFMPGPRKKSTAKK
ncbi:MAG: efflux RND transporter periplasmic adaptor subunit [Fibrobacteraceae bacterium]